MSEIRIASWNILNDCKPACHPSQTERIGEMAVSIDTARSEASRFVLYVCEGGSADNIRLLAEATDLSVVRRPFENGRCEWMAFLADEETADRADAMHVSSHGSKRTGFVHSWLTEKVKIAGLHVPHQVVRGATSRKRSTERALRLNANASARFVVGDMNSLACSPTRLKITAEGYRQAHRGLNTPLFPTAGYRGRNIPRLVPPINIDAIYAAGETELQSAGQVRSSASDHPLIWADYKIDESLLA